ncbi:MAG: hypothetical protein K0R59_100 [Sphingobacterium sp.]|jgi:ferric-dicitrate binding protein FerR (iron transport regulator)|nr:hypothetical protein [Sphingobacterium sp.]
MAKGKKDPKEIWDAISEDPSVKQETSESLWENIDQRIQKKERAKRKKRKSMLLILPVLLLGAWFIFQPKNVAEQYTFVTMNNRDTVYLKDGSHIIMEPFSELTISTEFGSSLRKVAFRGKGYFDIAKDKNKPFQIDAMDFDVEVLGTKFDLIQTDTDHRVQLFEGKVKINKDGNTTYLMPEEAWCFKAGSTQKHYMLPSAKRTFKFDHTELAIVLQQLEESYQMKIAYPDRLKDKVVSGAFSGNFEDILQIISFPLNLKPTRINEQQYRLK